MQEATGKSIHEKCGIHIRQGRRGRLVHNMSAKLHWQAAMQAVWEPWGTGVYQNFRETSMTALTCQNDSICLPTFRSDRKRRACFPQAKGRYQHCTIMCLSGDVIQVVTKCQQDLFVFLVRYYQVIELSLIHLFGASSAKIHYPVSVAITTIALSFISICNKLGNPATE